MIGWLRRWRAKNARIREATRRALAAFRQSGRGAGYMTWIVRRTDDETVVRVCFGQARPPGRAWFAVPAPADAPVRELSWDDVVPMGDKPWR